MAKRHSLLVTKMEAHWRSLIALSEEIKRDSPELAKRLTEMCKELDDIASEVFELD